VSLQAVINLTFSLVKLDYSESVKKRSNDADEKGKKFVKISPSVVKSLKPFKSV
jgi:hypothetical protein